MPVKLVRITTVPISLKVLLRNQLRFMSQYFDVIAVSSPGRALDDLAEYEKVAIASIRMTRSITPFKDLLAIWKMYCLLNRVKPTIVHTHTPKAGLLGMLAAKLAGVPIRLHTVAGLPLMERKGMQKMMLEMVERLTYWCATNIYPNSSRLSTHIIEKKYCREEKIMVLGNGSSNGIDTEYFSLNAQLAEQSPSIRNHIGIDIGDFVYVFIGRLVKDKGIEELVSAFDQLCLHSCNLKLLMIGDFEESLDPLSVETLRCIELNNKIIRLDFQNDIRPYLAISNALVFPSYREGFPNVPMQAGCFNLPAIVTDINGCNEIIVHGENGLIIPPKNTEALRQAMFTLHLDAGLYNNLKANARRMVVDRYEQKYFWNLLLKEYALQLSKNDYIPTFLEAVV
jgi:glycosyltransferase involved in cell wall biosynthesis